MYLGAKSKYMLFFPTFVFLYLFNLKLRQLFI